jgi:cyclase
MLEWFPVPPERKAKIESQIKSGLNRVFREIQREEDEKSGKVTTVVDDEEEYDE